MRNLMFIFKPNLEKQFVGLQEYDQEVEVWIEKT